MSFTDSRIKGWARAVMEMWQDAPWRYEYLIMQCWECKTVERVQVPALLRVYQCDVCGKKTRHFRDPRYVQMQ